MSHKPKFKVPYTAFSTYCLRTPILPVKFLQHLTKKGETKDDHFVKILDNSLIKEAIFLASPEFYYRLVKWSNNEIKDISKQNRIRYSFLKYLTRMSTRCTPFGLFSGCSYGYLADTIKISPHHYSNHKRVTKYDMHFLVLLADYLTEQAHIKKQLKFYPNSTLFKIGNRLRYVEYSYNKKRRVHTLESVANSEYLTAILQAAIKGATLNQLVSVLSEQAIEKEQAHTFIEELVTNQILISELEPTFSGKDFLEEILQCLEGLHQASKEVILLKKLQVQLLEIDKVIGNNIGVYEKTKALITKLKLPFEAKFLFQTDTFTALKSNSIDYQVIEQVKEGILFLNKITTQRKNQNLENFKKAFIKRYEHARAPLLKVLDIESGVGYASNANSIDTGTFLEDIQLQSEFDPSTRVESYHLSFVQRLLLQKLNTCIAKNENLIELSEDDIKEQEANWTNAPTTIASLIELIKEKNENFIFMDFAGGTSAANLLARFSDGQEELLYLTHEITNKETEAAPDKILAEIIHLPESRTGNILRRPHLREYEIPCLGKSSLPKERQILLSDLEISIERDTVKLYSKKLKKEILPRLTNAHNFRANPLPIYHFLCDLQMQNSSHFSFGWNSFFNQYKYLPRVKYKNIILAKARWSIKKKSITSIIATIDKKDILMSKIISWREKNNIPKWVQLVDSDNTLTVNLENSTSTRMFLETVKNRSNFILEEFLFAEDTIVKNEEDNFCNQILLAFHKERLDEKE